MTVTQPRASHMLPDAIFDALLHLEDLARVAATTPERQNGGLAYVNANVAVGAARDELAALILAAIGGAA